MAVDWRSFYANSGGPQPSGPAGAGQPQGSGGTPSSAGGATPRGASRGPATSSPATPTSTTGRASRSGGSGGSCEVLAETPRNDGQPAGLTRPIGVISTLVVIVALIASGAITRLLTGILWTFLPILFMLLLVPLALTILMPRVGGALFAAMFGAMRVLTGVATGVAGGVASGAARAGNRNTGVPDSVSVIVRTPDGGQREVVVAAARRLPVQSRLHVIGPRFGGLQHAWHVRNDSLGQRFLTRGVARAVLQVLVTIGVVALWATGQL